MDPMAFEEWLKGLSEKDRLFLEKDPGWKKARQKGLSEGRFPVGFVERTMEILEDGSESET